MTCTDAAIPRSEVDRFNPTQSAQSGTSVAILVVNYRSAGDVQSLFDSMPDDHEDVRAFVVDNSLDAKELNELNDLATSAPFPVVIIESRTNSGYGAGNNQAFAAAMRFSPEVVLIVNPDVTWRSGRFADVVDAARLRPDALLAVPTDDNGETSDGIVRLNPLTGGNAMGTAADAYAYPAGHCLVVSAERFSRLGGFESQYFLYCEELDLTLRNRRLGGSIGVVPGVVVAHVGGASINGGEGRSLTSYYYGTRSRVLLYRRHRELRRYLPALVVLRAGWATSLAVRGAVQESWAVARAIGSGLVTSTRVRRN